MLSDLPLYFFSFMFSSKEELESLSQGFEGFIKSLPEDTVQYGVYVISSKLSDSQLRSRLSDIERESKTLVKNYLKDYIWQKESFALQLKRKDGLLLLSGSTNFGDSVADEWLIVWILKELSKKFTDAWIKVYDNDGDFLLIEAADKLPTWLTPEVSENRVWLNAGKLLLIPIDGHRSQDPHQKRSKGLKISETLEMISSSASSLVDDPAIQSDAFRRILNYPAEISSNLHSSLITIPRLLAFVLNRLPSSISRAVEAFYLRDPISMKPLQQTNTTKLRFPPKDFVTVAVRFNKVGFAQIKSQQFPVPPSWRVAMANLMGEKELSMTEISRLETGMKVVCGFEMLIQAAARKNDRVVREIEILLSDIHEDEEILPTDDQIQRWTKHEDDEAWLDIDFTEFDRELSGDAPVGDSAKNSKAWADKSAQENLKKIVQRFQKFMNDEDAGLDGADLDESDIDDENDSEDDEVNFDERRFASLMKEMMGLPPEDVAGVEADLGGSQDLHRSTDQSDPKEDTEAGRSASKDIAFAESRRSKGKQKEMEDESDEIDESSDDEDINIDYNLAQNLLESLKGQVGAAGPASNLMGLMGMAMPRDEPEKPNKP